MPDPFPAGDQIAYDQALEALRDQIRDYIERLWDAFGEQILIGGQAVDQILDLIAATVTAAQASAANLTSVYLAGETNSEPALVDPVVFQRSGGVDKATVYGRAFDQGQFAMDALGKTLEQASKQGLRQLRSQALTDVQMAVVRQSRASLRHGGVRFYRRIPTGRETCALCLIACTQRYRVERLMAIHGGCDCIVGPIPRGMDLDRIINPQMLEATHQQVKLVAGVTDRGGRSPDYRDLIVSHEHGEIGPVLAWRHHQFTGPGDLRPPAARPPTPPDVGGPSAPSESPDGGWIIGGVVGVQETPRRPARTRQAPSYESLQDRVAPEEDPHRYFTPAERDTATFLEANGVNGLRSVDRSIDEGEKTPDGVFDDQGKMSTIEFKRPSGLTEEAVHRNIRFARRQSRLVVLDYRGSDLAEAIAIAGLRRAVRDYGNDVDQAIVVFGDGWRVGWKP